MVTFDQQPTFVDGVLNGLRRIGGLGDGGNRTPLLESTFHRLVKCCHESPREFFDHDRHCQAAFLNKDRFEHGLENPGAAPDCYLLTLLSETKTAGGSDGGGCVVVVVGGSMGVVETGVETGVVTGVETNMGAGAGNGTEGVNELTSTVSIAGLGAVGPAIT
jgi:hypothetical protein